MTVRTADLEARAMRAERLLLRGRSLDLDSGDDWSERVVDLFEGIDEPLAAPSPGREEPRPRAAGREPEPEDDFDEIFAGFQNAGPWPLPELAPIAIDEAEHAALLDLSRITSPHDLTLAFLEEWLPVELQRLHGIFSPAHLFVLTAREYCRAEMTLLCADDDHDISFEAAARLFRYEERLRARFQQLRSRGGCELHEARPHAHCNDREARILTGEEKDAAAPRSGAGRAQFARAFLVRNRVIEKNEPDVVEALLCRSAWWLGLMLEARSPHQLFARLAREANLFDRLSPMPPIPGKGRAPVLARAAYLPVAMALCHGLYRIRHEEDARRRLKRCAWLYRVLLARTHGVEAAAAFVPLMAALRWPGMPEDFEPPALPGEPHPGATEASERAPPERANS